MSEGSLIARICDAEASYEEIEAFCGGLPTWEYDMDSPFARYYSLERIIRCIGRYEVAEVTDKYLAMWARAYLWILNGGFKSAVSEDDIPIRRVIATQITEWLDSLAFYDEEYRDEQDLRVYRRIFTNLDRVYNGYLDWDMCYAVKAVYEDGIDYVALLYNRATKEFFEVFDCDNEINGAVTHAELNAIKERLLGEGFAELEVYFPCDDE